MTNAILGIDVSKKKLDLALLFGDQVRKKVFDNTKTGFQKCYEWTRRYTQEPLHVCTEFTGIYDEAVAEFFHSEGFLVSRVNPLKISSFNKSLMMRTKTDQVDSVVIAQYCKILTPAVWTPDPNHLKTLKELSRCLSELKEDYSQINNRLEAYHSKEGYAKKMWEQRLDAAAKDIKSLEKQLEIHIKRHRDLKEKWELLQTIPGIAKTTAWTLLAEIPSIERFTKASQLAAFAGLTPRQRQSGSSVNGKSRLSKIGSARLRKALYMPAVVAMGHNPLISALVKRLLQKGKCKMVALGAAMRKLVQIAFGVLKSQQPFNAQLI